MIRKKSPTYHTERRLFYLGVSSLLVLVGAYMYFVSAAVAHVVVRKEVSQEITQTQTRISDLESQYIIAKDLVLEEVALAKGFTKNEKKVFVTRTPASLVLSSNNERE